jgi:hypothetical protein
MNSEANSRVSVGRGAWSVTALRLQAPSTKLQRNFKLQFPKKSFRKKRLNAEPIKTGAVQLGLGAWNLVLPWSLVLGVWCFAGKESRDA